MRSTSIPRPAFIPDAATAPRAVRSPAERERRPESPATLVARQYPPGALASPPVPLAPSAFAHDFSRIALRSATAARIQPKLQVNSPGDGYEQQADRIADEVLRMPDPRPRHQWAGETPAPSAPWLIHRLPMQRMVDGASRTSAPPLVDHVLRSPGHPLDAPTRAFMEPRFGHDFGGVRVHTDARAAQSAAAIHARAFTAGVHVVFGAREYAPASPSGRRLLAHELAHTVQQSPGIHRQAADKPEEGGLTSPVLAGSTELEMVYRGELVIGTPSGGDFVERIQRSLLAEDPAALPQFGPDGHYGGETRAAVIAFQQRHSLGVDGNVGPETIRALDCASGTPPVAQAPESMDQATTAKKESLRASSGSHALTQLSVPPREKTNSVLPYLPGIESETTFATQVLPPVEIPLGTVHRKLSLVGTATMAPAKSTVTLSESELSLEFKAFATSLKYEAGEHLEDIRFSGFSFDLGDGKAQVEIELPSTCRISRALPDELVIGGAKLSGELEIVLEFKLVPRDYWETQPQQWKEPQFEPGDRKPILTTAALLLLMRSAARLISPLKGVR